MFESISSNGLERDLPLDDDGNAERVMRAHGNHMRFVRGIGWYVFDDGRWVFSPETALRWARDALSRIYPEDRLTGGRPLIKTSVKDATWYWHKRSRDVARIRAALHILSTHPEVQLHVDRLDADQYVLGCPNGYLNTITWELGPQDPQKYVTKTTSAAYDPAADCPNFLALLSEWFPEESDRARLQEQFGLTLFGSCWETRRVPTLWGDGQGGDLLISVLSSVLGRYSVWISPADFFLGRKVENQWFHQERLLGARMVVLCNERPGHPDFVSWDRIKHFVKQTSALIRVPPEQVFTEAHWEGRGRRLWVLQHYEETCQKGSARPELFCSLDNSRADEESRPTPAILADLKPEWPGILNWGIEGLKRARVHCEQVEWYQDWQERKKKI